MTDCSSFLPPVSHDDLFDSSGKLTFLGCLVAVSLFETAFRFSLKELLSFLEDGQNE